MANKTLYRPEYCEKVIEHMKKGYSYTSFAASVGVSVQTLYEWEKRNPEFSESKKRAMAECEHWWEDRGHALAKDNPNVWIFSMKARFGWSDKTKVEITGKDQGPIQIDNLHSLDEDQIDKLIKNVTGKD